MKHVRYPSRRSRTSATFALLAVIALGAGSRAAVRATPASGIDVSSIDHTCKACDDFYQFAEGNWTKTHPIPPADATYGNLTVLSDRNVDVLHAILDGVSQHANVPGSIEQKAGDYYATCMDTAAIDTAGVAPFQKQLGYAAELPGLTDLPKTLALLERDGVSTFFRYSSAQDPHDSRSVILSLDRAGLGLPDRDYYLNTDDKTKALRDAYVAHITKMFVLLGDAPDAAALEAATVLSIETSLAASQRSRVDRRDPAATDHKTTLAELQTLAPNFDWHAFLKAANLPPRRNDQRGGAGVLRRVLHARRVDAGRERAHVSALARGP